MSEVNADQPGAPPVYVFERDKHTIWSRTQVARIRGLGWAVSHVVYTIESETEGEAVRVATSALFVPDPAATCNPACFAQIDEQQKDLGDG